MIEAWIPTAVSTGALGLVWFSFRSQKNRTDKQMDEFVKNKEKYLTEPTHSLLCENATLKGNEHLTKEVTVLKDEIFSELRKLEKIIRDNGKKV